MLITVMYQDGKIGEIESYQLDDLIHSKKIKKFQRNPYGLSDKRRYQKTNFKMLL